MSLFDYRESQKLATSRAGFYGLLMAAIREADTTNLDLLASVFPRVVKEMRDRYNAPGGLLPGDVP